MTRRKSRQCLQKAVEEASLPFFRAFPPRSGFLPSTSGRAAGGLSRYRQRLRLKARARNSCRKAFAGRSAAAAILKVCENFSEAPQGTPKIFAADFLRGRGRTAKRLPSLTQRCKQGISSPGLERPRRGRERRQNSGRTPQACPPAGFRQGPSAFHEAGRAQQSCAPSRPRRAKFPEPNPRQFMNSRFGKVRQTALRRKLEREEIQRRFRALEAVFRSRAGSLHFGTRRPAFAVRAPSCGTALCKLTSESFQVKESLSLQAEAGPRLRSFGTALPATRSRTESSAGKEPAKLRIPKGNACGTR